MSKTVFSTVRFVYLTVGANFSCMSCGIARVSKLGDTKYGILYSSHCLSKLHHLVQQMHLSLLLEVCQWWLCMKQARSESLGADDHWDLVKWSLVTLCSTGEGEPHLTPLAQCLAPMQPHTPSPTSILVQCMKWELHQWALLDWVDTAVGVGRKWQLTIVSIMCTHTVCDQGVFPLPSVFIFYWLLLLCVQLFATRMWSFLFLHRTYLLCSLYPSNNYRTTLPYHVCTWGCNTHAYTIKWYII